MRKQFVKTVENILDINEKSVLLLGDIGVFGFRNSMKKIPNRVLNIGILEQSTIGISAGLALEGFLPIVHTIAPFMVERAYEQIKIDLGYQNIPVTLVSIGASYDYSSLGSTHHCPSDVILMKNIPNMQILTPGNSFEFDKLFTFFYGQPGPKYFRLTDFENQTNVDFIPGKGVLIKQGKNATVICIGNLLDNVLEATKDMDLTILYYNSIRPFDRDLISNHFNKNIIICEHMYSGTINFEVNEIFSNKSTRILNIGIPISFIDGNGTKDENDSNLKLDVVGIRKKLINFLNEGDNS